MKFSMERGALLKAVSQAQSVVERRNTIPILANVLIEAEGDAAQFRATDLDIEVNPMAARCCAVWRPTVTGLPVSTADLPEGAAEMPGVIVPRKTVGELRKLLDDDDTPIAVSVSETKVRFATEAITLTSKVIDGTFPDYTRVIPQGNTRKLEVDAAEFAKAVDRVATVSSERSRAVKLSLDEDRLVLSVNAPDSGAAEEELAVAYADERLEIGFNAKYLLEIASQVDRENAVFMFNSSGDPTLMREGNDTSAVYVVMPMRV
ncbi:Beta sliding clamp [Nymphon striatum]|nr:Beta sliding clamp [Nymphon striatum]